MQSLAVINEPMPFGMNDKLPAHLLPPSMYQLLQNSDISGGHIQKRLGTTTAGASLGAFNILGVTAFEPATVNAKYIIAVLDGSTNAQLYNWTGSGNFATLGAASLTKNLPMNFCVANNTLYGFNGTDVVSVDSSLNVTFNPTTVPVGQFGVWFHGYMFVAGTATFPNRLYWSNSSDPTTFVSTNTIDINPNDGDAITGIGIFNDELVVFKNNSIWVVTGFSGSTFSATTASGQNLNAKIIGYGTPSHRSIVTTGRDMYYMSYSGSVPCIRSLTQTAFATTLDQGIVSSDIETTMTGLSLNELKNTVGIYDGKYIYWAVTNGGNTNNLVLVFWPAKRIKGHDKQLHYSWQRWSGITPSDFTLSSILGYNKVFFGDNSGGGYVFELNSTGYQDNGVNVSLDARPQDFMLDPAKKAKFKYVYFKYALGSSATIKVNAQIDQGGFVNQETTNAAGSGGILDVNFVLDTSTLGSSSTGMHRTTLKQVLGHILTLQFVESSSDPCDIYDIQVLGQPKGYRAS